MSDLLTPQDVRKERFNERWFGRGYDEVQVDEFMRKAEHTIDSLSRRVPSYDGSRAVVSDALLVWLDIETTGLVIGSDEVLEVGVAVTAAADPLATIGSYYRLVRPLNWGMKKAAMVDEVRAMHEANGLIAALDSGAGELLDGVLWGLRMWLRMWSRSHRLFLAGNSVSFDRKFLENFKPDVFDSVSHRIVDVSSLDVIYGAMAPERVPLSNVPHTHRVMDCLDSSRLVYAAYLEKMFGKEAK